MHHSARFFPALLLAFLLAGCDAVATDGETIFLSAQISTDVQGAPVRFVFDADAVTPGRLTDVNCSCQLDVEDFLANRGFTKSDIISATVESARLVMLFPISERLDFLDEAILKLRAPGNSVTEVAQQSTFSENREAQLNPLSNRDVAGFMDDSTFEPVLQIDATTLIAGAEYEIGLVLNLRLELSGL